MIHKPKNLEFLEDPEISPYLDSRFDDSVEISDFRIIRLNSFLNPCYADIQVFQAEIGKEPQWVSVVVWPRKTSGNKEKSARGFLSRNILKYAGEISGENGLSHEKLKRDGKIPRKIQICWHNELPDNTIVISHEQARRLVSEADRRRIDTHINPHDDGETIWIVPAK